jgi:predicted nucleic acid-binding protein
MVVDPTTPLLFDASCLFTAADSPQGGSAYLLDVCARGYLRAVVSPDVLVEAERNILDKLDAGAFSRYRHLLASTPLHLVSSPSESVVRRYESAFFEDAHVVAAALASQARFLVTLDQALERRVRRTGLAVVATSPKEFLQTVFPQHPRFRQDSATGVISAAHFARVSWRSLTLGEPRARKRGASRTLERASWTTPWMPSRSMARRPATTLTRLSGRRPARPAAGPGDCRATPRARHPRAGLARAILTTAEHRGSFDPIEGR